MKITDTIRYAGVNDHQVDLFEGQYKVPNGMSYNSYVILDDKIAVMDTVDANFTHEWLDNIQQILDGRRPDYLIVQHMEPDHAANVTNFLKVYPDTTVVSNKKAFNMIQNFFDLDLEGRKIEVENGGTLSLGFHQLTFVFAPMVHWPEVMVTYDSTEKVLFSADGFGKFGALDVEEPWDDEARRYFIGIVGKYGKQVQALLKVAATLDIQKICPLHGPVLTEDLGHYIGLYDTWSSYTPETDGIVIAYTSVYGHTRDAVYLLAEKLKSKGCPRVLVYDLARDDMSQALSDAFRYSKLVLATTTYNASIYPFMNDFITRLVEHNFQNRTVGIIENGSWAPLAAKVMKEMMAPCKKIDWLKNNVHIWSAVKEENRKEIEAMTDELCKEYIAKNDTLANKNDMSALFRIGYGLYVVTSNDGKRDNGLIVNTVTQLTDNPYRVAGSNLLMECYKRWGADATNMNWSETYTALQQNTVEGQENPLPAIDAASVQEVQPYCSMWDAIYDCLFFCINQDLYDTLTPEQQAVVDECGQKAVEYERYINRSGDEEIKTRWQSKNGVTITDKDDMDIDSFKEAVDGVDEWFVEQLKDAGYDDGQELVDLFEK